MVPRKTIECEECGKKDIELKQYKTNYGDLYLCHECSKHNIDVVRCREVNIIKSTKIDIESITDKIIGFKQKFFNKSHMGQRILNPLEFQKLKSDNLVREIDSSDPYLNISIKIDNSLPSFIAPSYHYNQYIDNLILDIKWDDIKYDILEENWISNINRRVQCQIEAQAMILSIKTGLDRLISIFLYYYKGFSQYTTFGRIKKQELNGKEILKPKGFMSIVYKLKDSDKSMAYIYKNYNDWIQYAVAPRDRIVHYDDLTITWNFKNYILTPIHAFLDYKVIEIFAAKWYRFLNYIFNILLNKKIPNTIKS